MLGALGETWGSAGSGCRMLVGQAATRFLLQWEQASWSYNHSSWGLLRGKGLSSALLLGRAVVAVFLTRITIMKVGEDTLIESGFNCTNTDAVIGSCEGWSCLVSLQQREPLAGTEVLNGDVCDFFQVPVTSQLTPRISQGGSPLHQGVSLCRSSNRATAAARRLLCAASVSGMGFLLLCAL